MSGPLISVRNVGWAPAEGAPTSPDPQVTFEISEKTPLLFIAGPNGSGKTTLLKLISREIEPTVGSLQFAVEPLRDIGCLFQSGGLFPHISVRANIDATGRSLGWKSATRKLRIEELLHKKANSLSAGEERRVQFVRLAALDRKVWLLDEPTAGVDSDMALVFAEELERVVRRGRVIVCVSHDVTWVRALSARCAEVAEARIVTIKRGAEPTSL